MASGAVLVEYLLAPIRSSVDLLGRDGRLMLLRLALHLAFGSMAYGSSRCERETSQQRSLYMLHIFSFKDQDVAQSIKSVQSAASLFHGSVLLNDRSKRHVCRLIALLSLHVTKASEVCH